MRTIKVLHVADKFGIGGATIHGVSRLFSWWLPRYNSRHFEVKLCGLRPRCPAGQLLEQQGLQILHLGRGRFDLRTIWDLYRLIRRERFDLVHLHGYGSHMFRTVASRLAGVCAEVSHG